LCSGAQSWGSEYVFSGSRGTQSPGFLPEAAISLANGMGAGLLFNNDLSG